MEHSFFVAIEVLTAAIYGLGISTSAGMHDRVHQASSGVAGVSIDRSIRLLAEPNSLPLRSWPLQSEDCRTAAARKH